MTHWNAEEAAGEHAAHDDRPAEVLAGVHGSDTDTCVVQWAADEAVRLGADLRLVHVIDPGMQFTPYPALMAGAPNLAEDLERGAETILAAAGEVAHARHPDLVVHTSGTAAGLTTALPVVAHARCPVVVVPDGTAVAAPSHVVVGVDGSAGSVVAIETAFEIAAASGAAVTCVMGWSTEVVLGMVVTESFAKEVPEIEADCRAVADAVIAPVAARNPGVAVDVVVRHGNPADAIIEVAHEVGADVVVVGSRGHGGFVGLLLGSVSRRVVDHAGRVVIAAH